MKKIIILVVLIFCISFLTFSVEILEKASFVKKTPEGNIHYLVPDIGKDSYYKAFLCCDSCKTGSEINKNLKCLTDSRWNSRCWIEDHNATPRPFSRICNHVKQHDNEYTISRQQLVDSVCY